MVKLDTNDEAPILVPHNGAIFLEGKVRSWEFLAECVRLREAFDKLHHAEILGQEGFEALEELRIEAMKEPSNG